ncbi:MAG: ABC transporter ATP-binding protein [Candidatus Faecousia sp.]|nr:ABC transporter ATP-binding protein [Bacillota bacterium]MDY4220692.1 ABC transporter ATP-binding protein [Candidatus Faecousia sp.]
MAAFDEQEYTKSFDPKIWKRLMPILANHKRAFAGMFAFNLLCALIDVILPLFQQYAIRNFIEADTLRGLLPYALAFFTVILVQALSVVAFGRNSMCIEMNVGRDMRRELFTHLQTLSFSFYNVTPVGYLLTRVMSDTNRIAGMIAWNFTDILWALFYVFGSFASMLLLNWRLALVVLLIVPVVAFLTGYFQNRILHWNRKVRKINSRITGAFNEGITGAKTSKTLVIEEQNTKSFRDLTASMHNAGVRAARLNAVYIPLVLFCSTVAVAIVLLRGGYMVTEHVLEIATLSTFTTYAVSIFEPIQMTAANIAEFISLQASIERVTGLMDQVPQVKDSPQVEEKYGDVFHPKREAWEPLIGEIEFRDVTFRYPDGGENVLEHFSLHIPAGTTVAIVGETGAGKSTLVNLACRFFEPTSGQILIDGRDYRERSQLWLHSNIGYVLQNPHLFSGTVRENIRYGRLDATDEEIEAAARAVSADTVIAKLDKGWDSDVGEGGDRLSMGEKQLISFARAVLADPRIFVLDEATSSIDTQTEQLIQAAIDHLLKDRTSFLIAHRLSTIRKADLILVVKDGKIVEQGKHLELLQKGGYYHDLYSRQFAEENAAKVWRQ